MKMKNLFKYLSIGLILSQFETALGNNLGIAEQKVTSKAIYEKVFADLKNSKLTQKDLQKLGPGVTGGGDSCEQKIAYSYAYLLTLIEKDKIPAALFGKSKEELLPLLTQTQFSFDTGLEKGRPVQMLNVPTLNAVLLDRSLCDNSFEPLAYYAPLLMHEALRLAGNMDDADYSISKSYVGLIRKEANEELNSTRRFRILSGTAVDSVAMAWGFKDEDLDFEKFDGLSENEQQEFINKNLSRVENYLIDLKRMKIISTLRSGDAHSMPVTELDNVRFGNHQYFELFCDSKSEIAFSHAEFKWTSQIEKIFALDSKMQVIGFAEAEEANNLMEAAAMKALTKDQQAIWNSHAKIYEFELIKNSAGSSWNVKATAEIPKSIEPAYDFESTMKIEFKEGQFQFTFEKFKMQKAKY